MKIGLITIHHSINFGAVFQAYGLYRYLNSEFGDCCEFIDYRMNPKKTECANGNVFVQQNKMMVRLNQILHLKETLAIRKTRNAFNEFWSSMYRMSPKTINGDAEAKEKDFDYDVCISGSDQIFNLDLTNESKAFYLIYAMNAKKIAYSSSFGMFGLKENRKEEVKQLLSQYDAISVREKDDAEILSSEMRRDIPATCDPVFLQTKETWISISKPVKLPKHFILIYSMSSNPNVKETVNWLLSKEKMPVLIIKNGTYDLNISGKEVKGIGPSEFIHIISHATYIVTNSFHGTAFATIFEKRFFCLEEEKYKGDKRYSKLMSVGDCADKIIPYDTEWGTFNFDSHLFDGKELYKSLLPWIEESKKYLRESIVNTRHK